MRMKNIICIALASTFLGACGGTNNRGDLKTDDFVDVATLGDPLSQEEMHDQYGNLDGTWRIKDVSEDLYDLSSQDEMILEQQKSTSLREIIYETKGNDIRIRDCGVLPFERSHKKSDLFPMKSDICKFDYYGIDENSYLVDSQCEDFIVRSQRIYSRISTSTIFENATLSLSAPEYGDVNGITDTCARLNYLFIDSSDDRQSNEQKLEDLTQLITTISIDSPFDDKKLILRISFNHELEDGHSIVEGVYPVANSLDDDYNTDEVVVDIGVSETFGEQVFFFKNDIQSGIVTIDNVSEMTISGSFDLLNSWDETITGSFMIDL